MGAAGNRATPNGAISDTGNELSAADINDSVGIIDSIAPSSQFLKEFERFQSMREKETAPAPPGLVWVCSPNYCTRDIARVETGCDVICEKPFGTLA
ncbi:MAG: hypothetical protein CM15mP74_17140 [Halieaceae bacterium]|nr:MAG: hypothetical protein CM15mP74_17140 [Halieaceae bacterium]